MNRLARLAIAGLVLMVGVTPSWGGPPNPTASDSNNNTAGGTGALTNISSGTANTAFGADALFSNNAGTANTACGAETLRNNTSGSYNTANGLQALYNNTTGEGNTASGHAALFANTTGVLNTAIGRSALQINKGSYNTATGGQALLQNWTGGGLTASGARALYWNLTGNDNTASGALALYANNSGSNNTASGVSALEHNTIGGSNTALGYQALQNSTGGQNIAVGAGAGSVLLSGNKNIHLGHPGASGDNKTMRLGNLQTKTFIAGVTTAAVTGTNVVINASGQLGVPLSSARYKRDIETMGARSDGVLKLRPVTFVYTKDAQGLRQYGLIAEEVATVYPELVTRTATGEVQAVRYQELIPMLVNELQQQHQVTEHLRRELAELRSLVGQMRGGVAQR